MRVSADSIWQDVRYAGRSLVHGPVAGLAAVAMLGLGIGLTTAMFTLVDALILRPVPFRDPHEIAFVYMGNDRGGRTTVAPAVLRAWRESPAFAAAESAVPHTGIVEIGGLVVTRGVAHVTPGLFELLGGVQPIRGRLFDPLEGRAGADDAVLLSEDVWRGLFHADAALLGSRVTIDGESLVVVGILPSEFRFPAWDTVIWRPIDYESLPPSRTTERPMAYVRFAPNFPRSDALRLAQEAARAADAANAQLRPWVQPIAGLVLDSYYQRAVPLLGGAVVLVFLVLCANVSGLLLARLSVRRREFGMRSALGASRARLMRQAFVEVALLGAAGVVAGMTIGWALVSLSRAFLPEAFLLRTLNPLNVDVRALLVTSVAGVLATLAAGLLPAWLGSRVNAEHALRTLDRGGTETRGARAVTRGLLIGEIALACTLLAAAALLVGSFMKLSSAERGLDARGVLTATMSLQAPAFPDRPSRAVAARLLAERVRELPGVEQVAWSYGLPPDGGAFSWGDWQPDVPGAPAVHMTLERYYVGPDFFALYGIPLLRGRTFGPSDSQGQVIVGERLAHALWPGLDPVGRSFSSGRERFEVIGLVREIHHPSLDPRVDQPEFYEPFAGVGSYSMMSVRCGASCPDPAVLRHRLVSSHPAVRVHQALPLEDVYFEQLARPRAAAALGSAFAAIAVLGACGGLFSVLSYAVSRRRREFGIRAALGASTGQIRRLVLGDGLLVAVIGLSIGAAAVLAVSRIFSSVQYGMTIGNPLIWIIVIGLLALATLAASWRPSRDAARANPALLLREE